MPNINGGQWPPLHARIISTLKFFDLQDFPLTLLELHKFLISDVGSLKQHIDTQGEIIINNTPLESLTTINEVLECLENKCKDEVENTLGFYHLKGRQSIAFARLSNYFFGLKREKLIKKYIRVLKYLPFVRGVGLAGSQALGRQRGDSDIDLFIITQPGYLWFTRTLVTIYFHFFGIRRHGSKITNRFCLNHYVAGPKKIVSLRNLYTAAEYLKLRPLVYPWFVWKFQQNNQYWIKTFFPNAEGFEPKIEKQNIIQAFLEKILSKLPLRAAEKFFKAWQLPKIRKEKFIVVEEDELSFHPDSKQQALLQKFFFG